jgi:hypothetical protein
MIMGCPQVTGSPFTRQTSPNYGDMLINMWPESNIRRRSLRRHGGSASESFGYSLGASRQIELSPLTPSICHAALFQPRFRRSHPVRYYSAPPEVRRWAIMAWPSRIPCPTKLAVGCGGGSELVSVCRRGAGGMRWRFRIRRIVEALTR